MAQTLKEIRIAKTLKQQQVASLAGISRSHYTKIEDGVRTPSLPIAKRVADVLGINIDTLFLGIQKTDPLVKETHPNAKSDWRF